LKKQKKGESNRLISQEKKAWTPPNSGNVRLLTVKPRKTRRITQSKGGHGTAVNGEIVGEAQIGKKKGTSLLEKESQTTEESRAKRQKGPP